MKKKNLILICNLILIAALISCEKSDKIDDNAASSSGPAISEEELSHIHEESETSHGEEIPDNADPDILSEGLSEFDGSLIEYLYSNGYYSSDHVVSPYAFRVSLCLAAEGAEGDTLNQLVQAAGFSDTEQLDAWCRYFQSSITGHITEAAAKKEASGINKPVFMLCDSVWSSKDMFGDYAYLYKDRVENQFIAETYSCTTDELPGKLDKWVSDKTGGAIPTMGKDVTGASSVLASAAYINTMWSEDLNASVCEGVFTDISGTESSVNFIELTGEFLYADKGGTQLVVLPMEGNLSLVCCCGDRAALFDKLSETEIETVRVMIPEFEIGSHYDAGDFMNYLISRGAGEALIGMNADFGNICDEADWCLQEIIQESKITVGASSLTGKTDNSKADNKSEIKYFTADAPFSFAVFSDMDTKNNQLLLYGQKVTVNK